MLNKKTFESFTIFCKHNYSRYRFARMFCDVCCFSNIVRVPVYALLGASFYPIKLTHSICLLSLKGKGLALASSTNAIFLQRVRATERRELCKIGGCGGLSLAGGVTSCYWHPLLVVSTSRYMPARTGSTISRHFQRARARERERESWRAAERNRGWEREVEREGGREREREHGVRSLVLRRCNFARVRKLHRAAVPISRKLRARRWIV